MVGLMKGHNLFKVFFLSLFFLSTTFLSPACFFARGPSELLSSVEQLSSVALEFNKYLKKKEKAYEKNCLWWHIFKNLMQTRR